MANNILKNAATFIVISIFLLLAYGSEDSKQSESKNESSTETDSKKKFEVTDFKSGKTFEFHEQSIVTECTDPTIRKISVIDEKTAKIYVWHKGCPNNIVEEDEMIYSYRLDEASNWRQEYDWLKTENKVIILENESSGYYGGHMYLSKRYMISNAYNENSFIETRLFQQLDLQEYPSRDGVFSSQGGLISK
jgi:hypothetical protein